ncbi:hypothetical protein CGA24_00670 (plasmid) [Salmonella enterica subsp. enterica]|nr:hypothetical protein CGA24_00670 [Salmonella enterica subsp. enterica]
MFLTYLVAPAKRILQTVNLLLIIRKVRIKNLNIRIRPGFSILAGENEVFWQKGDLLWRGGMVCGRG